MQDKFIIGAIVNNQFGVLARVSALFSRRGYNIDSLVVGVTDNPKYSRMTIVASGDESVRKQVVKQLGKLYDVVRVDIIPIDQATVREHMLVKMRVENGSNAEITDMINKFGAKMVDFSASTITAEVTGEVTSNDQFIEEAKKYGILEICRAGAQALDRNGKCL